MKKVTILDAAKELGVSKEAIHNRIRRGSLEMVIENGIKYVKLHSATEQKTQIPLQADSKYYTFLETQNQKLQNKIDLLESETRELRDQKEQLLIDEKIKIEQIYRQKDEHLKSIIDAISKKFITTQDTTQAHQDAHIDVQVEPTHSLYDSRLISLKKYLKSQNISKKELKKVIQKFKNLSSSDQRVVTIGKKMYLDMQKHDYSDLLDNLG